MILVQTPHSRDTASQVTGSWVFLGEVADHKLIWERLPTSPGLCGEASPDPAESWKVLHPWLLWLPPSFSVCLPLQTELLEGRCWDLLSFESPALRPWWLCNKCLITNGSSDESITAGPLQTSSVECVVVSSLEQVD